jgi:hypothetical protein
MAPAPPLLHRTSTQTASSRIHEARENSFLGQSFSIIQEECAGIRPPRSWKDPAFPHSNDSMFVGGVEPKGWLRDGERGKVLTDVQVTWEGPWVICGTKRPLAHNSRGEPSWLFHCLEGEECGLDAHDVTQGSLGDCYFLSALALVATDTCCADGLVDDALDAAGCYGVSFWVQGAWQMVWVDGYFPCYTPINRHASMAPKPVYAKSANRREIWPMVVEKAFAKLHGTYEAIGGGGRIAAALQALTGGSASSIATALGPDTIWRGLCSAVEDPNTLVGAGTRPDTSAEDRCGIIDGHAYAVRHAVEVGPHRLLLLRNPWGHGEWKGPWGDGSKEWDLHPDCRAAVGNCRSKEDDGDFWMEIKAFCQIFATVDMCRLPGGHHHRTKNAELHPDALDDKSEGKTDDRNMPAGTRSDDCLAGSAAATTTTSKEHGHKAKEHGGKRRKK